MTEDKKLVEGSEKMSDEPEKIGEGFEIPKEIEEIIQEMPQQEKHVVKSMLGMSMQMGGVISPQMELMKKMTPEHVSAFLDGQREATQYQFKEGRDRKIFSAFVLIITMIFIIAIIILLKDKPDIMENVLYAAGGLVAGAVGGYGFGRSRDE